MKEKKRVVGRNKEKLLVNFGKVGRGGEKVSEKVLWMFFFISGNLR